MKCDHDPKLRHKLYRRTFEPRKGTARAKRSWVVEAERCVCGRFFDLVDMGVLK